MSSFSIRSLSLAFAYVAISIVALLTTGCMGNNDSVTRLTLTAPVQGFGEGACRVRFNGQTYELTGDPLQECRDLLDKLYNSEVILVDRDTVEREFYALEYCDPHSGDVLVALHLYGTRFSRTDKSFRVDIDGVGTTYVPETIGLQLHYILADVVRRRSRESDKKASN